MEPSLPPRRGKPLENEDNRAERGSKSDMKTVLELLDPAMPEICPSGHDTAYTYNKSFFFFKLGFL